MGRVSLSSEVLSDRFGKQPFLFPHSLTEHPLTSLPALEELAGTLPVEDIEHNLGTVGSVVADGNVPRAELSPPEMVRTIATNNCWMVLPVHRAPAYKALLDELFGEVQSALPASEGRIRHRQAVFFLASSGSTTPTHIDLEQGFLLHLHGTKTVRIGDYVDTDTGQQHIERFHTGGHRNVAQPPHNAEEFVLRPGTGVHVPAFRPHVVHTGGGQVALSLAIALRTDATLRDSAVHRANARIRHLGVTPRPPGGRGMRNEVKRGLVTTADRVLRVRAKRAATTP